MPPARVLWTPVDPSALGIPDVTTESGTYDNPSSGNEKFLLQTLKDQSNWTRLLKKIDEGQLSHVADRLTAVCSEFPMDRWSLVTSLGRNAMERKAGVKRVLDEELGERAIEFKIVESDVEKFSEREAGSLVRACRALCGMPPTVWIQIYV